MYTNINFTDKLPEDIFTGDDFDKLLEAKNIVDIKLKQLESKIKPEISFCERPKPLYIKFSPGLNSF